MNDDEHFERVAAEINVALAGLIKPAARAEAAGDQYKVHPAAEVFPLLEGVELEALANDIKANGQRLPILTIEGLVVDGRNRLRACAIAGVVPRVEEMNPAPEDVIAFVSSMNLARRHMPTSQRAAIAAGLLNLKRGTNRFEKKVEGPNGPSTLTTEKAAKLMNVSTRSVKRARKTMRENPEAHKAAKAGTKPKPKVAPKSKATAAPKAKPTPEPASKSKPESAPKTPGAVEAELKAALRVDKPPGERPTLEEAMRHGVWQKWRETLKPKQLMFADAMLLSAINHGISEAQENLAAKIEMFDRALTGDARAKVAAVEELVSREQEKVSAIRSELSGLRAETETLAKQAAKNKKLVNLVRSGVHPDRAVCALCKETDEEKEAQLTKASQAFQELCGKAEPAKRSGAKARA